MFLDIRCSRMWRKNLRNKRNRYGEVDMNSPINCGILTKEVNVVLVSRVLDDLLLCNCKYEEYYKLYIIPIVMSNE